MKDKTDNSETESQTRYTNILKKVKELITDKDVIKSILEEIPKELDVTKDLNEMNRKKRIVKLLGLILMMILNCMKML